MLEFGQLSGSSSAVERELPKLDVAGSIPVSRSNLRFVRYSVRNATVGSMLSARRVGTTQASMHTPNISAA